MEFRIRYSDAVKLRMVKEGFVRPNWHRYSSPHMPEGKKRKLSFVMQCSNCKGYGFDSETMDSCLDCDNTRFPHWVSTYTRWKWNTTT